MRYKIKDIWFLNCHKNCIIKLCRKYKRVLANQHTDLMVSIAPERSICAYLSRHVGTSTKIRRAYAPLRGLTRRRVISILYKASSGTGGSADRGGFVHGGLRLPDVDDRTLTYKNSHILRTYKRAINCIDSP